MIRREEQRLRRMFRRLMLLSLASPAALQACSSSSNNGPGAGGDDASLDTTADTTTDTTLPSDTGVDLGIKSDGGTGDVDLDAANCQPSQPYFNDASYYQMADSAADSPYFPCYYFVDFPCGTTYMTGTGMTACFLFLTECVNVCTLDGGFVDCLYWQDAGCADGSLTAQPGQPATIGCGVCNGVGRRPSGLRNAGPARAKTTLGAYFAEAAQLEAASVFAFERLGRELRTHAAPRELIRSAARSARDERRHTRMTAGLARRFGGEAKNPTVRRARRRKLEALARENAVEGCVRETYGAMVATWQAAHASDAEVRRRMTSIAADETRHAALAWAVARWADGELDECARVRVARARRAAVRRLARDVCVELPPSDARVAGLPSAREARALLDGLAGLWA